MSAGDSTAIRRWTKTWHRLISDVTPQGVHTRLACGRAHLGMTAMARTSSVPTADRCRQCWPDTKETDRG